MFRKPGYEWKAVVHRDKVRIMAGDGGCFIADIPFGLTRPLESNGLKDGAAIAAVPEMYAALRKALEVKQPDEVREAIEAALRKADRDL